MAGGSPIQRLQVLMDTSGKRTRRPIFFLRVLTHPLNSARYIELIYTRFENLDCRRANHIIVMNAKKKKEKRSTMRKVTDPEVCTSGGGAIGKFIFCLSFFSP